MTVGPFLVLVIATAATVSFANAGSPRSSNKCADLKPESLVRGKVESVSDGDTARVTIGGKSVRIRMLSIDTPEVNFQGMSQGEWGDKASAHLKTILTPGTAVTVEVGEQACDVNGRTLGYIWKGDLNNNLHMIEEGLAVNYCIFPNLKYCEDFAEAADVSIQEKKGIFSDSAKVELPYEWRRQMSNRPFDKYIGDIYSYEVYDPGSYGEVSIANRVFFMKKKDVDKPFEFVK